MNLHSKILDIYSKTFVKYDKKDYIKLLPYFIIYLKKNYIKLLPYFIIYLKKNESSILKDTHFISLNMSAVHYRE